MKNEKNNLGGATPVNNKKSDKKRNIGVIIVLIAAFFGISLFALADKGISKSDLVNESASGVDFKRPKQWQKVASTDADVKVAYTEDGKDPDDSDQALAIGIEDLGVDYNQLTEDQKKLVSDNFSEQFSDPKALESGDCEEIGNVETKEVNQGDYDTSFRVDAVCEKLTDKEGVKARIKMIVGVKDDSIHLVAITALEDIWEKSGEAFNEILDSVQPAN